MTTLARYPLEVAHRVRTKLELWCQIENSPISNGSAISAMSCCPMRHTSSFRFAIWRPRGAGPPYRARENLESHAIEIEIKNRHAPESSIRDKQRRDAAHQGRRPFRTAPSVPCGANIGLRLNPTGGCPVLGGNHLENLPSCIRGGAAGVSHAVSSLAPALRNNCMALKERACAAIG